MKALFPLVLSSVNAGFPSPAEDYIEHKIDLNECLVQHPVATFFVKVSGSSMIKAGIHNGDTLIVDRSLEAKENTIIIAALNGEFTVKRLQRKNNNIYLLPENDNYRPIKVLPDDDFSVWGVVTYVIHKV